MSVDEAPTLDTYDYRSARPGNNESIRVDTPRPGRYYVLVVGETAFSGVTLQARHN